MTTKNKEDLYKEILNRLHKALEIHPYLSGLMTNEYQSYLVTVAGGLDLEWEPEEPHPDWEIDGDTLEKFEDEDDSSEEG